MEILNKMEILHWNYNSNNNELKITTRKKYFSDIEKLFSVFDVAYLILYHLNYRDIYNVILNNNLKDIIKMYFKRKTKITKLFFINFNENVNLDIWCSFHIRNDFRNIKTNKMMKINQENIQNILNVIEETQEKKLRYNFKIFTFGQLENYDNEIIRRKENLTSLYLLKIAGMWYKLYLDEKLDYNLLKERRKYTKEYIDENIEEFIEEKILSFCKYDNKTWDSRRTEFNKKFEEKTILSEKQFIGKHQEKILKHNEKVLRIITENMFENIRKINIWAINDEGINIDIDCFEEEKELIKFLMDEKRI